MHLSVKVTLWFALVLVAGACAQSDGSSPEQLEVRSSAMREEGEPRYVDVEGSCEDPLAPTWESFGEGFVRNYCRGCHGPALEAGDRTGAPVGVDFATHQHVLERMQRFEARAASEQPTMPPGGGPDEVELELLRRWIACGAP